MAQSSPTQLTSFECFPELPVEIRLKIWRHTFPRSRIVGISEKFATNQFVGWNSTDRPPIVFRISRESREEALKHYKLSFGTPRLPATIYFNFKLDTLRFGHGSGDYYLKNPTAWLESGPGSYLLNLFLGKIYVPSPKLRTAASNGDCLRYIIIDVDEDIYDRTYFCWGEIRRFPNLQDLTLLPWNEPARMNEALVMFQSTLDKAANDFPDWRVPNISVISPFTRKELGKLQPKTSLEDQKK